MKTKSDGEVSEAAARLSSQRYLVEEWKEGRLVKYTGSDGMSLSSGQGLIHDTVVALGHYSLVATKGELVIADLQGEFTHNEMWL